MILQKGALNTRWATDGSLLLFSDGHVESSGRRKGIFEDSVDGGWDTQFQRIPCASSGNTSPKSARLCWLSKSGIGNGYIQRKWRLGRSRADGHYESRVYANFSCLKTLKRSSCRTKLQEEGRRKLVEQAILVPSPKKNTSRTREKKCHRLLPPNQSRFQHPTHQKIKSLPALRSSSWVVWNHVERSPIFALRPSQRVLAFYAAKDLWVSMFPCTLCPSDTYENR